MYKKGKEKKKRKADTSPAGISWSDTPIQPGLGAGAVLAVIVLFVGGGDSDNQGLGAAFGQQAGRMQIHDR